MNTHFCDIGVILQSELPDYISRFLEYLPPRTSDSVYVAPTCKEDILCEIKKMKPMKAPGHDSIGTKIIHLYPNNYRPISLLSHFDKIFDKILCKRLVAFLEQTQILYCHQYGFRKLHSTAMALIEITDNIKLLLDDRNYVIRIFSDFKKALDTVEHDIMLRKLDCYGSRVHANMFFGSYLINIRKLTAANGVQSDIGFVKCGVPQGSVLGPLFFVIH